MKNILVIPTWYPNGADKLMGIYHKEFCEALAKRENMKVNMLFVDRQRLNKPLKYLFMKKKEVIKENGYDVHIIRMLNIDRISSSLQLKLYTKKLEKAFKIYLKNNPKPDVLHAQVMIPAGYAACKLGKKYNIPVLVTEHASYYSRFFRGKNKKYSDFVLKNAYFTSVSNYMLDLLPDSFATKEVLPNLVDTEAFKKERKVIKGLRIANVSALRQGKRIDDLLEALDIIINKKKIKDVKLTIVGDGYLEDFYKDKCHELKLDKYVQFVGRKTKEEIANILIENNVFVISSESETFCIPGIEALASGMPVVSTKCFGPEEYIDDKCGKLVEVGNIEEMAEAIIEVYNNIDNYDILYLRSVADRYSSVAVTDTAINIYNKITKC